MKETYNDNDSVFHGWYLLLIFINTITIYQDFSVCFNMKINPLWFGIVTSFLLTSEYQLMLNGKYYVCSVRIGPLSKDKMASYVKCLL